MRNLSNIFGLGFDPENGPRDVAFNGILSPSRGNRDWSGLHDRRPFTINQDRVAIQRAIRYGTDSQGNVVAIDWLPPEFTSRRRAEHLISTGQAKFCGISGGE